MAGHDEVVIPIDGMKCAECAARIKRAVRSIDGVVSAKASFAGKQATVRYLPSKVAAGQIIAAIRGLGYRPGPPPRWTP